MVHLGTQRLETNRLILRKFKLEDYIDMYNNWASDENALKYTTRSPMNDLNQSITMINTYINEYNPLKYFWAIELKETAEVIGNIAFHHLDERTNSVDLGYIIGTQFWNNGYVTEALKIALEFIFNDVGINRVTAYVAPENIGSIKVLEKNNFTYEGRMKQAGISTIGIIDLNIYRLLNEEYKKVER